MSQKAKTVAILGVTGSVGLQAVDVASSRGYNVDFISANQNVKETEKIARRLLPTYVAMADEKAANELKTSLAEKSIVLSYTDEALELIAKASFSRKFGARNMRRYIQKEVEDRLAEQIIADYTHHYSVAKVTVEDDHINVLCM